eukprot:1679228-Alexandrium_andersonii.AAC.1
MSVPCSQRSHSLDRAAFCILQQLCAAVCALGRSQRAPDSTRNCARPPEAAERCILQLSAAVSCRKALGLFGGAH